MPNITCPRCGAVVRATLTASGFKVHWTTEPTLMCEEAREKMAATGGSVPIGDCSAMNRAAAEAMRR